tara:strand:+ start:3104 stop:4381 length:1278 start_codon:yes stop_codon:yes gene_type:complete
MKKTFILVSNIVLALAFLSAFAWIIKEANNNSELLGKSFDKAIIKWSSFPDNFSRAVDQVQNLPETFVATPENFKPINHLKNNVFALVSFSKSNTSRIIQLKNLRTDSVLKNWEIENLDNPHRRVLNPLFYNNNSIVYATIGIPGVFCIDESSKEIWKQKKIISHHSINKDHNNNVWLCTYPSLNVGEAKYDGLLRVDNRSIPYIDNSITCLDYQDGMILFHRSLSQILLDNELEYILLKSSDASDPLHINDVQPVLKTSKYFNKGDLFISCKNISTVFLYRPTTNKIVKVIEGPFQSQHDIDIINDSTISIFNNNTHTKWQKTKDTSKNEKTLNVGPFYSEVLIYHFNNESFSKEQEKAITKNEIYSFTEGLCEKLEDGSFFIEEQNSSLIWILKNDSVLYKNVLKSKYTDYHHLSNWTRIIKK